MKRDIVRFELRLDPELHHLLSEAARQNDRSLHAEILHRLKVSVQEESTKRR